MNSPLEIALAYSEPGRRIEQRINACVAMALLKDEESLARLNKLVKDDNAQVRAAAAQAARERLAVKSGTDARVARVRIAFALRGIARSVLRDEERLGFFLPEIGAAVLLPILVWTTATIILGPWPQFSVDLWRYAMSVALGVGAVAACGLVAAPVGRRANLADVVLELMITILPAGFVGGLATLLAYLRLQGDFQFTGVMATFAGAVFAVLLVRLQSILLRRISSRSTAIYALGLVLSPLTIIPILAFVGSIAAGAGAGREAVTVTLVGLAPALALASAYLRFDAKAASNETVAAAKRGVPRILILAASAALAIGGILLVASPIRGRSELVVTTPQSFKIDSDEWPLLLQTGTSYPLVVSNPTVVKIDTEGSAIQLYSDEEGGITLADGSTGWLDKGSYFFSLGDLYYYDELGFDDAASNMAYLAGRGLGVIPSQSALPTTMRLAYATLSSNVRKLKPEDYERVAGYLDSLVAYEKIGTFAVVADDPLGLYAPGSLVIEKQISEDESAFFPIYVREGPGAEVTRNTLRAMQAAAFDYASLASTLDLVHKVYAQVARTPVPSIFNTLLSDPDDAKMFDEIVQLLGKTSTLSGGEDALYVGGQRFSPISVGSRLSVVGADGDHDVLVEIVDGNTTAHEGERAYAWIARNEMVLLGGDKSIDVARLQELRGTDIPPELSLKATTTPHTPLDPDQLKDATQLRDLTDVFQAAGTWFNGNPEGDPPPQYYDGYFYVVRGSLRGQIVKGTDWDKSANPGFTSVDETGVIRPEFSNQDYAYLKDVSYLGAVFDPQWLTRFDTVDLVPNSPADVRARQGSWDGDDLSGYFICAGPNCSTGTIGTVSESRHFCAYYGWGARTSLVSGNEGDYVQLLGSQEYSKSWEETAISLRIPNYGLPRTLDFDGTDTLAEAQAKCDAELAANENWVQ